VVGCGESKNKVVEVTIAAAPPSVAEGPKLEPAGSTPPAQPAAGQATEPVSVSATPSAPAPTPPAVESPSTSPPAAVASAAPVEKVEATAEASNTEWNQWGGTSARNNVPPSKNIPGDWVVGGFDLRSGDWKPAGAKNIKWVAKLGSQSYGNPVVADGKIFVGTNNGGGWLKRYPHDHDLGVLLCFDLADGKFLWQHSSEKLPTGRVHDWQEQGICSAALVEGKRLWFVTSRGEIRCLDTQGFYDGENDGPFKEENLGDEKDKEADVIWSLDMMKELGISQHNMAACSLTSAGDLLFVCTSNGVDFEHNYIPAPEAPSFLVMNKNTKEILWTDDAPGLNILHGQWSSPAYGVLGGQPQVIFAGGDGWLRSYDPKGENGKAKLLWEFDANPKTSFYTVSGRATRNHLIGSPVIYEGLVYIAVGEDPEHGEGIGHLWCIDPTKRGDISAELAFKADDRSKPLPKRRLQAVVEQDGEIAVANPNSAVVWHYSQFDLNGNGKSDEFEETMHRTVGSVAIKDDILYIADLSGLFHCLNAKTGKVHWTFDMMSRTWGSPLVVDGKVFIGDDDGNVSIFRHSSNSAEAIKEVNGEKQPFYGKINMQSSVLSTPIAVNDILYIASKRALFAIEKKAGE
jgi:outer membrane protein assembly factor BamB